jgi:pimeloyl-ACP methyl ester carboxylesterase
VRIEWKGQAVDLREAGTGPIIVLLHGYPLDGAMWSSVARRLSDRFRVLKPDFPGRPENPASTEGSIESYADYVESIVNACEPPVGLAGFSMGGYAALALMKRRPSKVTALALIDTRAVADDEATRSKRNEAIATLREKGVEPIADAMLGKLLAPASLTKRDLVERVRRIMLRQTAASLESDLAAMRDRPDSASFLAEISVPTLVMVGEHDSVSPPEEGRAMADAIPGARFLTIPGAGHLTPMESPSGVAQALGDFFGEALAG